MSKTFLGWLLATVCLITASAADAQQPPKMAKIGWLGGRPAAPGSGYESFLREFRALGYLEGKNITIEYRSAENKLDRLPALADELIRLNVDVLLTQSTAEAQVAKNATKTIPIVFLGVSDPIAAGLIDSLARPGGNITGFTNIGALLAGKRLELLKETVPNLTRVAVLWDPQSSSAQQWKESLYPARELGLQLHSMEVSSADKLEGAFKQAIRKRSSALAVVSGPFINSYRNRITELATRHGLPAIYSNGNFVENGGLISYGTDEVEPFKRAAVMVDKILKGTKPADIPVEQPMKFVLTINLKTAKKLGLTIPPIVMMRAQRVIK